MCNKVVTAPRLEDRERQGIKKFISLVPDTEQKIDEEVSGRESSIDEEKAFPGPEENKDVTQEEEDSNIVNWDSPEDRDIALNWPSRKKWTMTLLLSSLTLLTPFASSMFAPSIELVLSEFHSSNADLGTFVVSGYLLGYAFGPLGIAPLSELYGRLPVYHLSTLGFIIFNIACAKSTNFPMLIVFRIFTGIAGSTPLTLGPGSIADMFRQEERGKIMAVWTLPVILGPTIGPIVGGYVSEARGWRWDFWFLIIATGVVFLVSLILQRETHPPTILEARAQRLRKSTGNPSLRSVLKSTKTPKELFVLSIIRPTKILLFSPIVFIFSVITAIVYGTIYLLFTTMPQVFEQQYGISKRNVGLTYLAMGLGQIIGVIVFGMVSDRLLNALSKGGPMKPEYRLPPLLIGLSLLFIGLLWYGWAAQYAHAWIVPLVGQFLIGTGVINSFMPVTAYLVDAFVDYAASATAANTVLRSLGGALLPLAGPKMYAALGLGWGNTLLAFIALACVPSSWLVFRCGEKIRNRYRLNL